MSIADKLTTIAENEQRVYKAGQLNVLANTESLNGSLLGKVVSANDVIGIEHNVGCNISRKNLLDINKIKAYYQENVSIDGDTITIAPAGNNKLYGLDMDFAISLIEVGKTYTFSIESTDYVGTMQGWRLKFADDTYSKLNYTTTLTITPTQKVTSIRFIFNMGQEYTDTFTVVRPQIEVGSTATAYTPYTSDLSSVNVSRYGKNLLEFKQASLSTGTFIEKLSNGAIMKGNYSEGSNNNAYGNGWYNFTKATINLKAGDVVTLSCDYTVLELDEHRTMSEFSTDQNVKKVGLYLCSDDSNHYVPSKIQPKVLGETVRMYNTFTITVDSTYHPLITLNSNKVRVENIQIEVGSTSTAFEEYKGKQTKTANADGTVKGITSIAPNMTLLTDTEGVVINANYYKDPDIVISNLAQSVALSGGEG